MFKNYSNAVVKGTLTKYYLNPKANPENSRISVNSSRSKNLLSWKRKATLI